jgi:uncharacterized protein YdiU (UPF0061 family)
MARYSAAIEDMLDRKILDERDIDFLNHLKLPAPDDVALEGIIRAVVHDAGSVYTDSYREIKGWFLGMESKRKYINEICDDLIDWLKDKNVDYPHLDLDLNSFYTWMKTSETFFWRYFFLLNDRTWSKIEKDLKTDRITELETLYDIDFSSRKEVANYLDSIRTIKDLIKVVEDYKKRTNIFFDLISKRKVKVKMAPFQVILLGSTDLRRTCKKIVNLAI